MPDMVEDRRVKRMTFNADADLLARAQQMLGTQTATDTITHAAGIDTRWVRPKGSLGG